MIELREMRANELEALCAMDRDSDTRDHITIYSLGQHRQEYARDDIVYLAIDVAGQLAGYFILRLEDDGDTVEFRRIVVARKGQGIGQAAITAMEGYCAGRLDRQRIWLDVFAANARGRHIYHKLGYRRFDSGELDGRKLLLLEKQLAAG